LKIKSIELQSYKIDKVKAASSIKEKFELIDEILNQTAKHDIMNEKNINHIFNLYHFV
jgi:hypothetical protein